jgi:hypothetical protein
VEEPKRPTAEIALVLEADSLSWLAIKLSTILRSEFAAHVEVFSTGSERKRFDKARKSDPQTIVIIDDRTTSEEEFAAVRLRALSGEIREQNINATKVVRALLNDYYIPERYGAPSATDEFTLRYRPERP